MKRYNQLLIKDNNKKQIYQMIEEESGICRAQIADLLKLSKTTVSALVDELIQEGYVVDEGASESNRQGRRPNSLSVNSRDNFILIINWHAVSFDIALVDTGLNVTLCREYELNGGSSYLSEIKKRFEDFMEAQCEGLKIVGICLIVPGMIDEKNDQIISVVLPTEKEGNYTITALRASFSGYPLAVLNDTACFAYAENTFGYGNSKNYMYLNINDGVGAAIISEGELLSGANGMATQFGHVSVDRNGYPCSCGNCGCLENQIGELALERLFREYELPEASYIGEKPLFKDLLRMTKEGNKQAYQLLEHMAEDLAFGLCNAISLFHPERIIIGGIGRKLGDEFLDILNAQMKGFGFQQFVSDVEIRYTRLGESSVVRGAAKYYLNKYFKFNDMEKEQLFCG